MQSRIATSGLCASLIALLMGGLLPILPQSSAGQISGTVYEQAGARLDHATVSVKNAATGAEHVTHPDDRGEYRFETLPAGQYSIRVSATGLSTVQINDIVIQPNKLSAINVTLPLPDSTPISVVQVSAAPEPVDTSTTPPAVSNPSPPPTDPVEESKAILREVAAVRDRLALSADQQSRIRSVFQDRQNQIAALRANATLPPPVRREKVKGVRTDAEVKFRALLNENQLDEYEEILRERRERTLEKQKAEQKAPPIQ